MLGDLPVTPVGLGADTAVDGLSTTANATPTVAASLLPVSYPSSVGAMPVALQETIKSYLYWQYNDDADLAAFVKAYNDYSQAYLNAFNVLNLPIYTSLTGYLLDWVGQGLYGMARPILPQAAVLDAGPYNTYAYNIGVYDYYSFQPMPPTALATDDLYKRCLTWAIYKGDGKVFNIRNLKRRVARFLNGPNGVAFNADSTYYVSVQVSDGVGVIKLKKTTISQQFALLVAAGVLEMPFQVQWSFDLVDVL